ncbi:Ribosomal large subunit pseudouridine synthase C [hydrothermal vent metagenome]|uniref:Ribosomal large subunit pseudouridine synthase C n=1 Tax=hydrothermal vent metagenome TaxID=652676 RepID=A0A3B0W9Z0_9ZZZZ
MQNKPEDQPVEQLVKNIFQVNIDSHGQRIDNFLLKTLKQASKSNIYKLLRKGQIRVNGKRTKPVYRVQHNDLVRIPPFLIPDNTGAVFISNNTLNLIHESIVFENNNFMVINKPSGLAVHSGTGVRVGLIEICKRLFPTVDIQLAHRLDRETSGCVVLTKNREALNQFNQQSKDSTLIKKYMALAQGVIKHDFMVNLALDTSARRNGERTVQVSATGKWAKTKFIVAEIYPKDVPTTLLQCQLFTGRTHQIRVHASATDHPLAGDQRYGNSKFNKKLKNLGLKRLFLHAASIQFKDGNDEIIVSTPLPVPLQRVLDKL